MKDFKRFAENPGEQSAMIATGRRPPDRRGISARWLIGTFLTGVTSCSLMGVALFAALEGRQQLTRPPSLFVADSNSTTQQGKVSQNSTGDRLAFTTPKQELDTTRRIVELSTVQKVGSKDVYRTQPFEIVRMPLAEERANTKKYPAFNALTMFTDNPKLAPIENAAQIVGSKMDVDMSVSKHPLIPSQLTSVEADEINDTTAEAMLRTSGLNIGEQARQIAALNYIQPISLDSFTAQFSTLSNTPDVRITSENVSIANRAVTNNKQKAYAEDIIPMPHGGNILKALTDAGYEADDVTKIVSALSEINKNDSLPNKSSIRLGIEQSDDNEITLIRASVYSGKKHIFSVALNDKQQYVQSNEPEMTQVLKAAFEGSAPSIQLISGRMPTIYDAVYQSALAYDLSDAMTKQLIRTIANDFDMQSRISLNDNIQIFYPMPTEGDDKKQERDIRYIAVTFGDTVHRYYRYQSADGTVDYYNSDGRNSKQFLLRKAVPNGVFRSPFGPRRHPILGYVRIHSGVDWAAPRGTPIIAAGDGVITQAGWSRGYGNHTEIKHANGYVTTYSHQNAFANGIKPGVSVKQGQVIGYVGSTGLSTGPHLHYEMIVNGTKVDPMRIRLPDGKALKGKELEAFKKERDRIDELITAPSANISASINTNSNNG